MIKFLLAQLFESLSNLFKPSAISILSKVTGYGVSQLICTACRLKIPDAMKDGPKSVGDISSLLGLREAPLKRMMTGLCGINILKELPNGLYKLKKEGKLLLSDAPGGLHAFIVFLGRDPYKAWGDLEFSLKNNQAAIENIVGENYYSYLSKNTESAKVFHDMEKNLDIYIKTLLDNYDFSEFKHIADISGGPGRVLFGILEKHKTAQGTLFELPFVIDRAKTNPNIEPIRDRLRFVGGDLFQSVDVKADAYFLKNVLHNWDDEKSLIILKNLRKVIPENGKLLISESIVSELSRKNPIAVFMDLLMLVMHNGVERTMEEYKLLFDQSGFKMTHVKHIDFITSIIELQPV